MTINYARTTFEDFFSKNKSLTYGDKLNASSFSDKYYSTFFEAKNQNKNLFQAIESYLDSKNEYIISLVYKLYYNNECNQHRKFTILDLIFVTNLFNIYSVEPTLNIQLKTKQHKIYDLNRNATLVINPLKEYNIKLQNFHIDFVKSLSLFEVIIRTNGPQNSTVHLSNIKSVFNDKLNIYCKESSGIPQNKYLELIIDIFKNYGEELKSSLESLNLIQEKNNNLRDLDNVNIELKNLIDDLYSEINSKSKKINSLEYDVSNLNLEIAELNDEYNKLNEEKDTIESILNDYKTENEKQKELINSLKEEIKNKTKELNTERENNWLIPKPF